MCPCALQRGGECERCGRPCEHGRWVRVRGCDLCGIVEVHEEGEGGPAVARDAAWVEDRESLEDLSGP
eukprot:3623687-Alexandrium_andersonii.AAC.1